MRHPRICGNRFRLWKLNLFVFGSILFWPFLPAIAGTIHVPADQPTIQSGIDAAIEGDTVLVAADTYSGTGNMNLNFKGKPIIVKSASGPDSTVIDCQGSGRGVIFNSNEDNDSVLDGFTIRNGYSGYYNGGGIYCENSSPTITNCIVTNNKADSNGGGIYCTSSSPTISHCAISDNSVQSSIFLASGGGIYCISSSPSISDCTISGNVATYVAGGIYFFQSSSPTIANCTISENLASKEGGGIYCKDSDVTITGCRITGNTANTFDRYEYGGGVYCNAAVLTMTDCFVSENHAAVNGGGVYLLSSSATISGGTISSNKASGVTDYEDGGGIYSLDSSFTITNCDISRNQADRNGGGIYCRNRTSIIKDCTISENRAIQGGGLYFFESSPTIDNCLIANNIASKSGGGILSYHSYGTASKSTFTENRSGINGGGVYCDSASLAMVNCIFSGNIAVNGGGIGSYGKLRTPSLTNCIIVGNLANYYGGGIYCNYSNPIISSCTIAGNRASSHGGGIYGLGSPISVVNSIIWENSASTGSQLCLPNSWGYQIAYSDIQGGWFGADNYIVADPPFADPKPASSAPTIEGDYHLLNNSPCIDAGTDVGAPNNDIDDNLRPLGYGFDMGADEFEFITQYPLTVNKTGIGNGTITSTPCGIDCGIDCSAYFDSGTVVTLASVPDAVSIFSGWSEACDGTGDCQVTMSQAREVTATFQDAGANSFNLTPYRPSDWSDKIVVSSITDTTTDSSTLLSTDTLFLDWAVINDGSSEISQTFYTELFIDGTFESRWVTNSLLPNYYIYINDYAIGNLGLNLRWRFVDSMTDDTVPEFDTSEVHYFDAGASYAFTDVFGGMLSGLSARLGVTNLTDEDPEIIPHRVQANTDPSTYDTLGRRYFVNLTYNFD